MRIGMILDKTFPPDPRVENEALSLAEEGHDVFLFCLTYGNQMFEEEFNGIHIKRYQSNKLEYKLSALSYDLPFYSLFMKGKIKDFIKRYQVKILHIHDITIAETVFKVNQSFNLPIVLDLHDNIPENMIYYPHMEKFPGKYIISPKRWKKREEELIKKADKVITVSPEFVDEVISRTHIEKNKMVLVPNSVRESFYKNCTIEEEIIGKYDNNFMLLYLGDTNLRRGLLTVIQALPELVHKISNLKLVIVGKNTTDVILKEEVKKLDLSQYVDFEGWKDLSLFPSYIRASSVCLSPLNRSKQHDVAYANKIFQYMSYGKPIVVSNAIAQEQIVKQKKLGLVHEEKNPKDLAEKILWLYQNQEKAKEFGNNGKRFIQEEFSWEITSKALIELYETL